MWFLMYVKEIVKIIILKLLEGKERSGFYISVELVKRQYL